MSLLNRIQDKSRSLIASFKQAMQSSTPEPAVRAAMEADGWKFRIEYFPPAFPMGTLPLSMLFVTTPTGEQTFAHGASDDPNNKTYIDALRRKRVELGLIR